MSKRKKLTPTQRRIIWNKGGRCCAYCGQEIKLTEMQADHLVPMHNGGANDMSNLVCACRSCNWYKSTFSVETFRQQIAAIPARLRKNPAFRIAERYGLIEIHEKPIVFRMDTHKEPF